MIAFGGYSDFESLLSSGDLDAMKSMAAQSEKWFRDPANSKDPQAAEERARLEEMKAEIERLEGAPVAAVA
ncbi:MAG: hypothetical protein JO340_20875 [Acidobacteriaceae bacterium]|nr:hypothetical protein [Acidobacteriaceae bacterium]